MYASPVNQSEKQPRLPLYNLGLCATGLQHRRRRQWKVNHLRLTTSYESVICPRVNVLANGCVTKAHITSAMLNY